MNAQYERYAAISEELGEAIQAAGKCMRHGPAKRWPPIGGPSNQESLEEELAHVLFWIDFMARNGDIRSDELERHLIEKRRTAGKWLHFQVVA